MKKYFVAFAVMISVMAVSTAAMAAGTVNNWSVELAFSTDVNEDSLDVLVGEGQALESTLKPPSLPGQGITGDAEDAFIRTGIKRADETELGATLIEIVGSEEVPAKVWELEVDTENADEAVYVEVDVDNLPSEYDFSIIIPDTGEFIEFNSASQKTQILTSGSSASKVYLLAGTSKTFATYSDDGKMFGMARLTGRGHTDGTTVKVYNAGGCSEVSSGLTTGSAGEFELSSLAAGDYHVEITRDNYIGVECDLTVTSGNYAVACEDLYGGDFNGDKTILMTDLVVMKPVFGAKTGDGTYEEKFDLNLDGNVNLSDLTIMKPGFGKTQSLDCD